MDIEKAQMGPFDLEGNADVPNERTLIGARTISPFNGSGDWTIAPGKANHWLFEGTGIKEGDRIRGTLVFEKAGPVTIEYLVRGIAAQAAGGGEHDH